jgi:guanine nucleotide-binding protein alpha-1 subunit
LAVVGRLWHSDPVIQTAVLQRKPGIHPSAGYFFNELDRVIAVDYQPSDLDILKAQFDKSGLNETSLKVGELDYIIVNVANQTSERRKWLPLFHVSGYY